MSKPPIKGAFAGEPKKASKAAIKAHPAPIREKYRNAEGYAEACRQVYEARAAFDAPKYDPDAVMAIVCQRLSLGESLRSICKSEGIPVISVVMEWMIAYPHLAEQYARARAAQADYLAEEIIEISDDGTNDFMEKFNADGDSMGLVFNSEHVQRSRLRVDSRKWYASKLAPKKYGDVTRLEGSKDNPVQVHSEIALQTDWESLKARMRDKD